MAIFTVIATLLLIVVININNKVVLTVKSANHSFIHSFIHPFIRY